MPHVPKVLGLTPGFHKANEQKSKVVTLRLSSFFQEYSFSFKTSVFRIFSFLLFFSRKLRRNSGTDRRTGMTAMKGSLLEVKPRDKTSKQKAVHPP